MIGKKRAGIGMMKMTGIEKGEIGTYIARMSLSYTMCIRAGFLE